MKQTLPEDAIDQRSIVSCKDDPALPGRWDSSRSSPEACRTGIESLLLGLNLRGDATTSELAVLNQLADQASAIFLYRKGRFLHTGCLPLIPEEAVNTALQSGTRAVFTNRCQVTGFSVGPGRRIHTAVIHTDSEEPIVLGLISPDLAVEKRAGEYHFGNLLPGFREAATQIGELIPRLTRVLKEATSNLIINRATGRVVAANKPLRELLDRNYDDLIGCEYSELKDDLLRAFPGQSMSMQNITHASLNLTIVSLGKQPDKQPLNDPFVCDYLAHKMRNKITAVTTAASHLDAVCMGEGASEQTELTRIILKEATALDSLLSRLSLLVNYHSLRKQEVSVSDELQRAITLVKSERQAYCSIRQLTPPFSTTIKAPPQALTFLIEAGLLAHLGRGSRESKTTIRCTDSSGLKAVAIEWETERHPDDNNLKLEPGWTRLAANFAAAMGVEIRHECAVEQRKLLTKMSVSYRGG